MTINIKKQKKMNILIKKESKSNLEYGKPPKERSIKDRLNNGIINLDKPLEMTSIEANERVKKILNIKQAGHGGTLDPNASGVLPIGLRNATKILRVLLKAKKEYVCVMRLHEKISNKVLDNALKQFTGTITQKPPVRAAVKREIRERKVYDLKLLERKRKSCLIRIKCEAGTYIKKLCHQIGEYINIGINVTELRRISVGPFEEKNAITLKELRNAYILWKDNEKNKLKKYIKSIEKGVKHLPKIWVLDSSVWSLTHGADLAIPGISKLTANIKKGDLIALMTLKNELIALGRSKLSSKEIIQSKKGIATELERVILNRKIYPKITE